LDCNVSVLLLDVDIVVVGEWEGGLRDWLTIPLNVEFDLNCWILCLCVQTLSGIKPTPSEPSVKSCSCNILAITPT
jgi:hypothetical protein